MKHLTNETLTKCISPNEEVFTNHVVSGNIIVQPTPTPSPERINEVSCQL